MRFNIQSRRTAVRPSLVLIQPASSTAYNLRYDASVFTTLPTARSGRYIITHDITHIVGGGVLPPCCLHRARRGTHGPSLVWC
jgi:hypothetical protein